MSCESFASAAAAARTRERSPCAFRRFADLMARVHGVGSALCLLSKFVEQRRQEAESMSSNAKEYIGLLQATPVS